MNALPNIGLVLLRSKLSENKLICGRFTEYTSRHGHGSQRQSSYLQNRYL